MNHSSTFKLSSKDISSPLTHFWSKCVGAGRANEGLRANWLDQLKMTVEECGFQYIRFHGLLHDDMFVYREIDGEVIYNWQYIDELFDRMLDMGIRPFVEFGFCPADLASGEATQFWWKGNITPPKDEQKWYDLIYNLVTHWKERYGLEEIRTWYYEVWNEPNLRPFWAGTQSQYFQLYKITVQAVKAVDANLKVGGPATSNFVPDGRFDGETEDIQEHMTFKADNIDTADWQPVWMKKFLQYCQDEKLPVDFVSTHPYPTDFALDGFGQTQGFSRNVNSTKADLMLLKTIVTESAYPKAEIHLTEWSSSPSPRDYSHDYMPAAAFVVKANLDSTHLADSLSYWTFSDVFEEGGAGNSIFHGGFGMINFQGILKPTFHAYRFMNLLGDEEIIRGDGGIVTRHKDTRKISALLYNYDEDALPMAVPFTTDRDAAEAIQNIGGSKVFHIEIRDVEPHAVFVVETVDKDHGFALPAWREMGMPEPPTREQTKILRELSQSTHKRILRADTEGLLKIDMTLAPWSIVSIRQ